MQEYKFLPSRYKNHRVGEFLKELGMTEGRGTGIPKILHAISANGSPEPIFHTDEDRTYFLVEFPIHAGFRKEVTPLIDKGKVFLASLERDGQDG